MDETTISVMSGSAQRTQSAGSSVETRYSFPNAEHESGGKPKHLMIEISRSSAEVRPRMQRAISGSKAAAS